MPLSADQQAALRVAARSNPACVDAYAARDIDALVAILSVGRTRPSALEVGNGTIIETIGVAAGNALLDHIAADPDMRYVKPLLEQGRLKVGSLVAQGAIQAFVDGGVISQAQGDALRALGIEPNVLSRSDVADALFNSDGTEK